MITAGLWLHPALVWYSCQSESVSCPVVDSLQPHRLYSPWNSPGQNSGVSSLSFFQGIFPTQGLNPGLPHCRQILYQLSHRGSPRILEQAAYPFSSVSLPGASMRKPTHDKVMWRGLMGKASQASGFPPGIS